VRVTGEITERMLLYRSPGEGRELNMVEALRKLGVLVKIVIKIILPKC